MLPFSLLYLLYLRIFCCEIWKEKKVSLLSRLVTLGITLTLVNVVQRAGFSVSPYCFTQYHLIKSL